METKNYCFKAYLTFFMALAFQLGNLAVAQAGTTAEYKCSSSRCTMCVDFGKKVVCSERYSDDSESFEKVKQFVRFVNDGLITPPAGLKDKFKIEAFGQQFFNCELMVKKAEQIRQATQNMCVAKTYQKTMLVPRAPASVKAKKNDDFDEFDEKPKKKGQK